MALTLSPHKFEFLGLVSYNGIVWKITECKYCGEIVWTGINPKEK